MIFPGFADELIDVGEVRLRVRHAGQGPAVLLVHGHPRTGATWHRVAPLLVEAAYAVFTVVGHDRGCYVALRMALDHPGQVYRLVVLDGVPIAEALDRCDARFATLWYHWFFFAQAETPERVVNADPIAWYHPDEAEMGPENYAEMVEAIRNPETVRAMLEDYRAGLTVDADADRTDQAAGRKVTCPTLYCWSSRDDMEDLYGDPLAIWADWATDLRGHPIDSGHHVAEENPAALTAALLAFLPDVR